MSFLFISNRHIYRPSTTIWTPALMIGKDSLVLEQLQQRTFLPTTCLIFPLELNMWMPFFLDSLDNFLTWSRCKIPRLMAWMRWCIWACPTALTWTPTLVIGTDSSLSPIILPLQLRTAQIIGATTSVHLLPFMHLHKSFSYSNQCSSQLWIRRRWMSMITSVRVSTNTWTSVMQMITRGLDSEGLDIRELKVRDKGVGGVGLDIDDREVMILSFFNWCLYVFYVFKNRKYSSWATLPPSPSFFKTTSSSPVSSSPLHILAVYLFIYPCHESCASASVLLVHSLLVYFVQYFNLGCLGLDRDQIVKLACLLYRGRCSYCAKSLDIANIPLCPLTSV